MFYLGQSTTERNCESCNERFIAEECKKNGKYFLYLPMESQIKDLLSDEKLRQRYLTNRIVPGNINTGMISDITSGKLYTTSWWNSITSQIMIYR